MVAYPKGTGKLIFCTVNRIQFPKTILHALVDAGVFNRLMVFFENSVSKISALSVWACTPTMDIITVPLSLLHPFFIIQYILENVTAGAGEVGRNTQNSQED